MSTKSYLSTLVQMPTASVLVWLMVEMQINHCSLILWFFLTISVLSSSISDEPIVLQKYNKVAYEMNENAVILCEVQAYPRPEFHWSLNNNPSPLTSSGSKGHYEINTSVSEREGTGDVYISNLTISNIKDYDYGDYNCRWVPSPPLGMASLYPSNISPCICSQVPSISSLRRK